MKSLYEKLNRIDDNKSLNENYYNNSGLSDEVEKIIHDAVKAAFEVGHADSGLWKYILEDLEGFDFDVKLAKKYFNELLAGAPEAFEGPLTESCDYAVKRYGQWHWGIIGPNKLMLRKDDNKLLLFKSKNEASAHVDSLCRKDELTEGNNVSSKLPPALDNFLQDMAQMYGMITYSDIMSHEYSQEDLNKLKNYRRRFRAEAPYEGDEETDAIMRDIAEKVAKLIK